VIFKKNKRYNHYENTGWNIDMLHMLIVEDNPCISYEDGINKAELVFKELNKVNNRQHYNHKIYFKYNIPFSNFEEVDDGEINFLEFKNYKGD
jgi:hypothetical protein